MQLIIAVQRSTHPEEFAFLCKRTSKCPPLVRQLRLFLEDMKLICCGGRIHNAPTSDLSKFPYLLQSKHPITKMIVVDTHKRLHHGGCSSLSSLLDTMYMTMCKEHIDTCR